MDKDAALAIDRARKLLAGIPGIYAVALGEKVKNGMRTGQISINIYGK